MTPQPAGHHPVPPATQRRLRPAVRAVRTIGAIGLSLIVVAVSAACTSAQPPTATGPSAPGGSSATTGPPPQGDAPPASRGTPGPAFSTCRSDGASPQTVQAVQDAFTYAVNRQRSAGKYDMSAFSAAFVTPTGQPEIVNCGVTQVNGAAPVVSTTRYEIGSETKTFTAAALARMSQNQTVALTDPLTKYAPPSAAVPSAPCGGASAPITLQMLAGFQSGLKDVPPNQAWKPGGASRSGYTRSDLWQSFTNGGRQNSCQALATTPGTAYAYSNWGFAVLGTVLADAYQPGQPTPPYGRMLQELVTGPIGMPNTELQQLDTPDLAIPTCAPIPLAAPPVAPDQVNCYWDNNNAFAGGGGLVSTAADMARFEAANLGAPTSDPQLTAALQLTHQSLGPGPNGCAQPCQAMGWWLNTAGDPQNPGPQGDQHTVLDKNGGTYGSHSHTWLVPDLCWGATFLTNSSEILETTKNGVAGKVFAALQPRQSRCSGG